MKNVSNYSLFGLLYAGAVFTTLIASILTTDYRSISLSSEQIYTLIYLGIISSGLAFYLWNTGATKVNAGTLAVFNNLKIPVAILVSLFIFGEEGDLTKLSAGILIMFGALLLSKKGKK